LILITGGSGFVGRATLTALTRGLPAADGCGDGAEERLRLLTHRRSVLDDATGRAELAWADLSDPSSLNGICDGVDTLVHLASAIDEDEELCTAVNVQGTKALLAEALRAGVQQIVYLSTAAVYGTGPHCGIRENEIAPAPVSATSRTRLIAEQSVLAVGGVVLRPMFVYGPGDTWFVPSLARTVAQTPVTINGGRARLSLIAVEDLAEVIAVTAVGRFPGSAGTGIYHVNHPEPVSVADLLAGFTEHLGVPAPIADLSYDDAVSIVGDDPRLARQVALVALDHYYESSYVWQHTGLAPASFGSRFAAAAPWYRAHLAPDFEPPAG
jgi:nucleoside-diphosphate-sugar epimerase